MCADIPLIPAGGSNTLYARTEGEILPIDKRAAAPFHNVAADYFKTFGIPLLAGRDFNEHDVAGGQNVILISQGGAKRIFGNENPIGKTLLVGSDSTPAEIVGILGDSRTPNISAPDDVELYLPW